jgi:hypothetical protein
MEQRKKSFRWEKPSPPSKPWRGITVLAGDDPAIRKALAEAGKRLSLDEAKGSWKRRA